MNYRTRQSLLNTFCTLVVLLSICASVAHSQGARLSVFLNSKEELIGELLSVRDSSIVLSTLHTDANDQSPLDPSTIRIIPNPTIERVLVYGKSRVLEGLGKGALYGAACGAVVGFLSGDDPPEGFIRFSAPAKALMFGIAFGGVGGVLGAIAGASSSTGDTFITPLPGNDFSVLRPLSKFSGEEPSWLSAIR